MISKMTLRKRAAVPFKRSLQVCSNGSFILITKSFINVLIHERCLSNTVSARVSGMVKRCEVGEATYPLSPRMITFVG
jgi:hypothetical protein